MATSKTPRALSSFICHSCRQHLLPQSSKRAFSSTPSLYADNDTALSGFANLTNQSRRKGSNGPSTPSFGQPTTTKTNFMDILDAPPDSASLLSDTYFRNLSENDPDAGNETKAHKLHVYATKHNTHITFVQPPRSASQTVSSSVSGTSSSAQDQKKIVDVLLSLSAGNIGFRKAGRGSYDAAYQLGAFALKQIQEKGMLRDVRRLEVVLRGFGAGREAVSKVLLGAEGRSVRDKISAVVDATRLKIGGARSPKPRRLG